jgi:hypothetical protein
VVTAVRRTRTSVGGRGSDFIRNAADGRNGSAVDPAARGEA